MSQAQKQITILGGGTAGWMAANLLQHHLAAHGFSICLLESQDIGTIGVGEGSTPHLKAFFDTLGVQEQQWMPACNATYKNGISFYHWSTHTGFEHYFHPFPSIPDKHTARGFLYNAMLRQQGFDVPAHPDQFFLSAQLAQQQLNPKAQPGHPIPVNYGYHFDSGLLGQWLKQFACDKGVKHLTGTVERVTLKDSGEIHSLILKDGQPISADFFVDCSGFQSLLLQQNLKVPFVSYQQQLFNDKAIALPSPSGKRINTQTISSALRCGWAWDIPLTHRTGNGYVYSSAFCSADEAEAELRGKLGLLDDPTEARHLNMRVGRVQQHWAKNCLAAGLSQGFIEPLEATALHLVQETLESFISAFKAGGFSAQHRDEFNQRLNHRFDGICDYIHCHYKVNSRNDSDYWQACRENSNISDSLAAMLDCWQQGGELQQEIERLHIGQYYSTVSWYCLLAGYGHFPTVSKDTPAQQANMRQIQAFIDQCLKGFNPGL